MAFRQRSPADPRWSGCEARSDLGRCGANCGAKEGSARCSMASSGCSRSDELVMRKDLGWQSLGRLDPALAGVSYQVVRHRRAAQLQLGRDLPFSCGRTKRDASILIGQKRCLRLLRRRGSVAMVRVLRWGVCGGIARASTIIRPNKYLTIGQNCRAGRSPSTQVTAMRND